MLLGIPAMAAIDDPPASLIGTSTTLAKVRSLYERAHGVAHTKNATIFEDWRLMQDGQTGSLHVIRLGKDYRETTTLGPLVYENGMHGGTRWQQNRNGLTFVFSGFHERSAIDEKVWESREIKDVRDVRLIGESVPVNAYVIDVNPRTGRHEWLFIEKRTGVIVRRERIEKHRRYVTAYDDFKQFDGTLEPSHIHTTDSLGNERDQMLLSRVLDTTPDAKDVRDVDVPPSRRTLVEFPFATNVVRLPVRVANGLYVVRVGIGRNTYDFLLDSGAAGIVIDPAIAESMNLERYGQRVGATLGTFSESTSIVPSMTVGTLRLRNVVARVVPVPFRADDRTRIAGLLGFDFFADTVVHIDHERNVVDAHLPATFKPPAEAVPLPLALDDKQPAVRAHIGSVAARMIVDTGANRTVLESAFADRADVITDRSAMIASRFRGVGGIGTAQTVRLKQLEFAGAIFTDAMIDVSPAELGVEDIDGIIGTDLLRDYDVYFDYRSNLAYIRTIKR
ncbi:MAG: hypothetical protein NVSMB64_02170 [Candidatus Velthaea sp.]